MLGTSQFIYDFDKFDAKDILEKFKNIKSQAFVASNNVQIFLQEDVKAYNLSTSIIAI